MQTTRCAWSPEYQLSKCMLQLMVVNVVSGAPFVSSKLLATLQSLHRSAQHYHGHASKLTHTSQCARPKQNFGESQPQCRCTLSFTWMLLANALGYTRYGNAISILCQMQSLHLLVSMMRSGVSASAAAFCIMKCGRTVWHVPDTKRSTARLSRTGGWQFVWLLHCQRWCHCALKALLCSFAPERALQLQVCTVAGFAWQPTDRHQHSLVHPADDLLQRARLHTGSGRVG